MRKILIPKRNGKFRTIYLPSETMKVKLRHLVSEIAHKVENLSPKGVCHGFCEGKSPVTNAMVHVGHQYTLSFDLEDFFDTVTERHLKNKLTKEQLELVLVDGSPRQGLPTSPAVANLAASDMDKAIISWRDKCKHQFVYTRYADDMAFSYDDVVLTDIIKKKMPEIVGRCGFKINKSKTKLQSAKGGRRIITGIGVDELGIYPTRKVKRKLRAARHQNKKEVTKGLKEWCKLKPPKEKHSNDFQYGTDIEKLTKTWKLPKLKLDKLPNKGKLVNLGKDMIITGDPVYMLGMSTWTTGWTSCLSQPNGQYRAGVIFWCYMRGTRLAMFLSDRTKTIAGIERRVMRARALVHTLRNGVKIYDRLYGNPTDVVELEKSLKGAGYLSCTEAKERYKGEKVVGHAPSNIKIYFDNLTASVSKSKAGAWKNRKTKVLSL